MFATLASDQSCEIDFQSISMKVIWSTIDYLSTVDTNLGLIRCLQHWHLVSLESKINEISQPCTGIVFLQSFLGFALRILFGI
jgi:hypothetical protein